MDLSTKRCVYLAQLVHFPSFALVTFFVLFCEGSERIESALENVEFRVTVIPVCNRALFD